VQAVILTAGRGTRLSPVTDYCPKPLIPFWGRPFIAYVLGNLRSLVDEAVLVVGPDGQVERALGSSYGDLPLRYATQLEPGGTGDALLAARELLDDDFLMVLGDTCPPPETVREIIARSGDAALTVLQVDDPHNHPGVGIRDGLVVERLWVDDSDLVDAGMFRLPRLVCDYLDELEPVRGELRILSAVGALIDAGLDVRAVQMRGPWLQYGDHEGVAGVCRVMNQLRPYTGDGDGGRDSSVEIETADCEIRDSLVFGPGELAGCTITESLVYCATRVEGATVQGEIAAWV